MIKRSLWFDLMAEEFILQYSDDEFVQNVERFWPADLPILLHQSPFQSEDSLSESDTLYPMPTHSRPSTPSTPTTPATPSESLGASFSSFGFSSKTSEEELFATPSKRKRKRYIRKNTHHFSKGNRIAVTKTWVRNKTCL